MNKIWVQITAGSGPAECCLAARLVMEKFIEEAKNADILITVLSKADGQKPETISEALLLVEGNNLNTFIAHWEGTIQWVFQSPFRKNCKRKNWFVGIFTLPILDDKITPLCSNDLFYEAFKASGPGGQHVNKTNSAVRLTHKPSGISVVAQEERSQLMNKKLALAKLYQILGSKRNSKVEEHVNLRWQLNNSLERGNPVRTFKGLS